MTHPLAEKIGINFQSGTLNVRNLNIGIAERLEESGDRVRILVVAANPLGSSPLKLDHEVKTIQEALRRSRNRDNFVVEYRLAATPSELRRALLDLEPHVLHFSGHGSGEQGLLFVSDESAGAIYRSDSGEVRSRSTSSNEIKFVPAQPLANLLQLCEDHLECVVLNACYSDVQGDAISANIPFTIGMRDVVEDNVAIKFSQGFYDAIGAGKGYESAFKWGKVAIEFDLANNEATRILVLRKKGETVPIFEKTTTNVDSSRNANPDVLPNDNNNFFSGLKKLFTPLLSSNDYFNLALEKQNRGDKQGAINDYNEAIRLNPNYAEAYNNRGLAKNNIGNRQGAMLDYNEAIRVNPKYSLAYYNRGLVKYKLGDKHGAIADYNKSIRLNPDFAEVYNSRGIAKRHLNDIHASLIDYSEAISLSPNYAIAYNNRGNAKSDLGDKQGAINDYNEAIRPNPNYADSYNNRGLAKSALGDTEGAIVDYNEAIRLNPNYADSYNNRGIAKSDLGDKQGAIADLTESIQLNPNLSEAYYHRGVIKKQRGEKQEALADFRKAAELYQKQGDTEWYNKSRDRMRELRGG